MNYGTVGWWIRRKPKTANNAQSKGWETRRKNMAETVIAPDHPRDGREWEVQCARCGSSLDFERCEMCEDGHCGHDCGEDCCCCMDPEPNVICDACKGRGSWPKCASGWDWCKAHPREGRENIEPETPEWYTLDKFEDVEKGGQD